MGGPNINRILKKAKEVYDDMHFKWLASSQIGTAVTLYYPPTYTDCPNCEHSEWGNTYRHGGPAPFSLGSCPMCGGSCQKQHEETEEIRLRVYDTSSSSFSKSALKKMGISIDVPTGELLTIGDIADISLVTAANYAVFYSDIEDIIGSFRYKVAGEIRPHGFGKDTFFYCFWTRV